MKKKKGQPAALMVDASKPYEELTKIHKLAVDRFDGNVEEAIAYIFHNHESVEELSSYSEEFTAAEASAALQFIDRHISQNCSREEIHNAVELAYSLQQVDMTEEEIRETEKNPFIPKMWRSAGLFLLFAVCVGVVVGLGERFLGDVSVVAIVASCLGIASTNFAFRVAGDIMTAIHFRKAKRLIAKEDREKTQK